MNSQSSLTSSSTGTTSSKPNSAQHNFGDSDLDVNASDIDSDKEIDDNTIK